MVLVPLKGCFWVLTTLRHLALRACFHCGPVIQKHHSVHVYNMILFF